jgi:predicted nucleic acid-binding protein
VKYLADTDEVIDYLKGRSKAVATIDPLLADGVAISVITFGEVYEGIYTGRRREHQEEVFRRFVEGIAVLDVTREIARRFAIIRGVFRSERQLIPAPDLLIAATALHHDLAAITRNLSHFDRVPGLRVYKGRPVANDKF